MKILGTLYVLCLVLNSMAALIASASGQTLMALVSGIFIVFVGGRLARSFDELRDFEEILKDNSKDSNDMMS